MVDVALVNGESILGAIGVGDVEVQSHVERVILRTVEDVANALMEAEADAICKASRYQHSPDRLDTRAGSYKRRLMTKVGKAVLRVPRLRTLPFTTQIVKRYKTMQGGIEAALLEMYLAGVSVRRVSNVTAALCETAVSSSAMNRLNRSICERIEQWRNRPITGGYPYVSVDGICLKRICGGEVQNVSVLVAAGVNEEECREILGVVEGGREDKEAWRNFLRSLKERGLNGVKMIVSDKCLDLHGIIGDLFPEATNANAVPEHYLRMSAEIHQQRGGDAEGDSRSER